MKGLEMQTGTIEANFTNKIQELEERIVGIDHIIEHIDKNIKENIKSINVLTGKTSRKSVKL